MVGDDNVIRENCTMSIGTIQDQGLTTVGSRNLFMANAHVAHDCQVGSDVILANNVALGGHVIVGDHAILGGQSAAHQFVRIGAYAMVGGAVGLRRAGFTDEQLRALRKAYGHFYREQLTVKEAVPLIEALKSDYPGASDALQLFIDFVTTTQRGCVR